MITVEFLTIRRDGSQVTMNNSSVQISFRLTRKIYSVIPTVLILKRKRLPGLFQADFNLLQHHLAPSTQFQQKTYHSTSRQMFGKFDNSKISFSNCLYDPVFANVLHRLRSSCSSRPSLTIARCSRCLTDKKY